MLEMCPSISAYIRNSHVAKTGDIKDFVITEESGIAKGVRRITAVTGEQAQDIKRRAISLQEKLDGLERLDGKEKDAGLKSFGVVCFQTFFPHALLMLRTGIGTK